MYTKKFPWHIHLLFSTLKILFWDLKKYSIAIKTDVKIPSLLPIILCQSTTPTGSVQIYMEVSFSLLRFKYPETLKNFTRSVILSTKFSQTMFLKNFCYFLGGPHLKRILYYKKAPVNISSISNSKKPQWDLLCFASRTVVNGKQLWLSISGKTKLIFFWRKYLCFLQNIHYLQKKMFLYGKKVL